jgi:hypothetical protein
MNSDRKISASALTALLRDYDLELTFLSPNGRYRLVYSTAIVAKDILNPSRFTRTYHLVDEHSKSTMVSPWDVYVEDEQVRLLQNLLNYSNYKLASIAVGWQVKCQKCGSTIRGKIWRNSPKNCGTNAENAGCGSPLTDADKTIIYEEVKS